MEPAGLELLGGTAYFGIYGNGLVFIYALDVSALNDLRLANDEWASWMFLLFLLSILWFERGG